MNSETQRDTSRFCPEIGIDTYTLLCIKQVTNKDLLYSTGNSTQYSIMACTGKESKKEQIYVSV